MGMSPPQDLKNRGWGLGGGEGGLRAEAANMPPNLLML